MKMTEQEANNFFGKIFRGNYNILGNVTPYGPEGWQLNTRSSKFATFDFNGLTELVLLAHKECVRVEIKASGPGMIRICIWQRKREGKFWEKHPTIEQAIEDFNKTFKDN
jgi:hypothetical protein